MPFAKRRRTRGASYRYGRRKRFKRAVRGAFTIKRAAKKTGFSYRKLRVQLSATTSATGILADYFSPNRPDLVQNGATAVEDWTSVVAMWDQYKVKAIKLMFIPFYQQDTSSDIITTGFRPGYIHFDNDDSGSAPSSTGQAVAFDNFKLKNMARPWSVYYRVPDVPNASVTGKNNWLDTSSTTSRAALKVYSTGNPVSTTLGSYVLTLYAMLKNAR